MKLKNMNAEEFVNAIRTTVLESSIKSVKKILVEPPGRKPADNLVKMSKWYNSLSQVDKEMVDSIIEESIHISVFGFLCVLDGVRSIEKSDNGTLKLYYERQGQLSLLTNPPENLHELL